MNTELTWVQRDRMLRDAHRRRLLAELFAEHLSERAFGPIGAERFETEAEFAQNFDPMDGVS